MQLVEAPDYRAFRIAKAALPRDRPTFTILLDTTGWPTAETLEDAVTSIACQECDDWDLIVGGPMQGRTLARLGSKVTRLGSTPSGGAGTLNAAMEIAKGDYLVVLPRGSVLPVWAVARYQQAAMGHPTASVLFGDEDLIDEVGRRTQPWFKPQWNAELILAQDYVSHACAISLSSVLGLGKVPGHLADCPVYAVLLAISVRQDVLIQHVAHVLCHMRAPELPNVAAARLRTVADHMATVGGAAEEGPFGTVSVQWALPSVPPSVTIIIPTRDRVDLLDACVTSLLRTTGYSNYDVVIVDNGSVEAETAAWFETAVADGRVSVLRYDQPYNYSAINNFAAARARGEYLCLLNNDTEIIDREWLDELMRYASRPEVGAVGAKLLYDDRSIQHAGVVIGLGNAAGHAHRGLEHDREGYFALAHSAHFVSAVTAACLVVERKKFDAVGGLDEASLQIAYNDVDFCLKLGDAGWRNVYAPRATLIHHESKSRGLDLSLPHISRYMRELAVFQRRWKSTVFVDPMHHSHLDRASEIYRIRL